MTTGGHRDPAPGPMPLGVRPREGGQGARILVVDDSADMRHLLREVLELRGHRVTAAASSAAALAAMAEQVPDLVITDLMMPGMSGFSLRSLMLRRPELAVVPVIVLSAYWARPGETLEVAAVLTKPVNLDRLHEAVDRALNGRPQPVPGG